MSWGYPWAISGTDLVPMDVARQVAFDAVGGHEGVTTPKDCQVKATAVASNQVRVMPGSVTVLGAASGQFNEAYSCRNTGASLSPAITATPSGGGRSDLVYAHVTDPDQPGNPLTAAVVETRVVEGVLGTTTSVQDAKDQGLLGADVSGYALARIDRSTASTGVVAQADIVDLRELAGAPRRLDLTRIHNQTVSGNRAQSTTYENWPGQAMWTIDIPRWAVRAQLVGHTSGFRVTEGDGGDGGNVYGTFRALLGSLAVPSVSYNYEMAAGKGRIDTATSLVGGDLYLPASVRGTSQTLSFQAKRDGGTTGAYIETGGGQVTVFTIVFYESPDEQGWED